MTAADEHRDDETRELPLPSVDGRWTAVALVVFAVIAAYHFRVLLGQDLTRVVIAQVRTDEVYEPDVYPAGPLQETDHRFVVWQVARNAYTLLERPLHLFDAEPCHPAEDALALGESSIGLGVVGIPAWLVSRDPIATYNIVFIGMTLLAALAMYLLVRDLTASAAAGIVAGALFAFSTFKTVDPVHYWARDATWGVYCLYFGRRVFAGGKLRDAIGLGVVGSLQIAGSFYPLLATAVISAPYTIWLVVTYGVRQLRISHLVLVAVMVGITAAVVLGPYLSLERVGGLESRDFQYFMPLSLLLPGERLFAGWLLCGLVVVGLLAGRRRALAVPRDPRLAIVIAALLVWNMAAGGNQGDIAFAVRNGEPLPAAWPNLYGALAKVIPGLAVVRAPAAMWGGALAMLCVLAGIGVAAVFRSRPGRRQLIERVVLVALAAGEAVAPAAFGTPTGWGFAAFPMRPDTETLAFYAGLEADGNAGPILEVPVHYRNLWKSSATILLGAYHHRRISACFNSNLPPEVEPVKDLALRLPERGAIEGLRELGFTTIILNHEKGDRRAEKRRAEFEAFESAPDGVLLRRLAEIDSRTAYAIVDGSTFAPASEELPVGEGAP